jgi:hypothetical protein
VKYQSPYDYYSKVIAKVKVFGGWQNDRQDKNNMLPNHQYGIGGNDLFDVLGLTRQICPDSIDIFCSK